MHEQSMGNKLKALIQSKNAPAIVIELDWKESILHPSDRCEAEFAE